MAPLGDGVGTDVIEIIDCLAIVPLKGEDVPCAPGYDHADCTALALQHRVSSYRRAVHQVRDVRQMNAGVVDGVHRAHVR